MALRMGGGNLVHNRVQRHGRGVDDARAFWAVVQQGGGN